MCVRWIVRRAVVIRGYGESYSQIDRNKQKIISNNNIQSLKIFDPCPASNKPRVVGLLNK